jgi:hypothetical protein
MDLQFAKHARGSIRPLRENAALVKKDNTDSPVGVVAAVRYLRNLPMVHSGVR